ncbi:MAG: protease inhibitor I42 family protein [Candidatus Omnitrophota bacterium]
MKKLLAGLLMATSMFLMVSCSGVNEISLELKGDKMLDLRQGQVLKIALESNPTTGYQWVLYKDKRKNIIGEVSEDKYVPKTDAVGSGGIQTFRLKAMQTGQEEISLRYQRSWGTHSILAKKYIVQINVK